MSLYSKYIYAILASIAASAFPFAASIVFDSPAPCGVFSADIFIFVILLAIPKGKILWKMPFIIILGIYAITSNALDIYAVAGITIILVITSAEIPRKRKCLLPFFILFSLSSLFSDWANFFYSTFVLTIPDIWGLAKFFWWGLLLFFTIPLLQILSELAFAHKILWGNNRLEISHKAAYIIITSVIGLNIGINLLTNKQPIINFAIKKWMWQLCTPGIIGQNPFLQEDIKAVYPIWENKKKVVADFSKPTVVVLVESFGVNKSVVYTDSLLIPYKNSITSFIGLFLRKAAHTQGAEWEDFEATQEIEVQEALPRQFKRNKLQTWFIHGYDGSFYEREENYSKFGFDNLLFKKELGEKGLPNCHYGFEGICDSAITNFIDSLLTDSISKFIYWTTLDAHPPYEFTNIPKEVSACNSLELSKIDCTYFTLQQKTAQYLIQLAQKHPNYRFIIRGDHRPMGSLEQSQFVQSFYFRWVPLIILN